MGSPHRIQASHPWSLWRIRHAQGVAAPPSLYQVTDRLHTARTVRVSANAIGTTVSAWLAELGANSPLADDLARAVCDGDWPAAYVIGEHLSVDVTIAA